MVGEFNAGDRRRDRREIPLVIIDATRKNFLHYGVGRTTMADIARAVGMPRQTLYEYVASRDDLVDAVLVARIKEIAEDLKPIAAEGVSFADALVETSVAAIDRARSDRELMNIFATGPGDRVQQVVAGPNHEIHDIVVGLLGPILDRGARSNVLRTDKTPDEIVDWIRAVYLSLIAQPVVAPRSEREILADFLLPSIMSPKDDNQPQN
jgi:AcrR family transcriptional regulator